MALSAQACSQDDGASENGVLPFNCYDIMLSNDAAYDDKVGRIRITENADPWRSGDVVYIERDGLFMFRDKQQNWSRHWGFGSLYGSYDPRGVRPIAGQRYYCEQTGCEYVADDDGKLIPTDNPVSQINVTTWNIGGFNSGNSGWFNVKSDEEYQAILNRFAPIIEIIDADLIGLCEFLPSIFEDKQIRDDLMSAYPSEAISEVSGDYKGKALFSRFSLSNPKILSIHGSIALEADATIGGRVFKVCICHPVWWKTYGDPNMKSLQYLADRYKYVGHVILMGDFNILRERVDESLKMFTDAGFSTANLGKFGAIVTSYNTERSTPALDNIMVKGAEIISVSTVQVTPPGLDPNNPRIEDELLWDAVNPSDHFPFSAKLLIK